MSLNKTRKRALKRLKDKKIRDYLNQIFSKRTPFKYCAEIEEVD